MPVSADPHHAHDHPPHHVHPPRRAAQASAPSLLRASAANRLGGVAVVLALVWAAVFWALA